MHGHEGIIKLALELSLSEALSESLEEDKVALT